MRRSVLLLALGFVLLLLAGTGMVGRILTAEAPATAEVPVAPEAPAADQVAAEAPSAVPSVVLSLLSMATGQGEAAPAAEDIAPAALALQAQETFAEASEAIAAAEDGAETWPAEVPATGPGVAPGLGLSSGFTCGFVSGARRCRSSSD